MRGEHENRTRHHRMLLGSSPHARGTHEIRRPAGRWQWIIPACAGNTDCEGALRISERDHPRMRGEHPDGSWDSWRTEGSSPHARGTLAIFDTADFKAGIIPACAGNTPQYQTGDGVQRDHPRMRGEHYYNCDQGPLSQGSSPHARGTL